MAMALLGRGDIKLVAKKLRTQLPQKCFIFKKNLQLARSLRGAEYGS